MEKVEFELTQEHVKLLRRANVMWYDCETGAPGLDCKRPYGNSDVEGDVCNILGWSKEDGDGYSQEQRDKASLIHKETETALSVVLTTSSFEPGVYVAERCMKNWALKQ